MFQASKPGIPPLGGAEIEIPRFPKRVLKGDVAPHKGHIGLLWLVFLVERNFYAPGHGWVLDGQRLPVGCLAVPM